jgi:hypothetical protein
MVLAAVATAVLTGFSAGTSGPAASATTGPADLTSSAPVTVVASGLASPRGLAWGPGGHLLVAEAGTPGSVCSGSTCYGLTGQIADISSGTPVPIVTGLASLLFAGELNGIGGLIYADGQLYTTNSQSPQAVPSGLPADLTAQLKTQFGALLNVTGGHIRAVANPGSVDYQWSQAHQSLAPQDFPDANPYALARKPGGGFYLVDSASNTLDSIDRSGNVRVLAFIPTTPAGSDAVPSCDAVGPDGAVYIGQLTGVGNSATAANVYRYEPWSGSLTVWQRGFSAISGCGFGANGDFYVTELDTTGFPPAGNPDGAVIQISHDGTRTVLGAGQLFGPGGFLAGPDGSIYVSNHFLMWPPGTGSPTDGEVVRIG